MEREELHGGPVATFYGGAGFHCWTPSRAAARPPPRCPVLGLQKGLQTLAGGLQNFASSPLGGIADDAAARIVALFRMISGIFSKS